MSTSDANITLAQTSGRQGDIFAVIRFGHDRYGITRNGRLLPAVFTRIEDCNNVFSYLTELPENRLAGESHRNDEQAPAQSCVVRPFTVLAANCDGGYRTLY